MASDRVRTGEPSFEAQSLVSFGRDSTDEHNHCIEFEQLWYL